jgi:hypothetical protein
MASVVSGEATIHIKLAGIEQARAQLASLGVGSAAHVPGGAGGGAVPGIAPGGGMGVPGASAAAGAAGGGGSFLSGIFGFAASNPLTAAALAAGGAFVAPIVGDAAGGVFGRLKQAGTDVSEMLGLGSWNREGQVPGKSIDRTVSQLGIAGNFLSDEQIKAVNRTNTALIELETKGEGRVRTALGTDRVVTFFEEMVSALKDIKTSSATTAKNTEKMPGVNALHGPH